MLDYRLKTFLLLCKNLNYTKTAEQLQISQPAVSQHIRFLEQLYEIKLFEYSNRKLHLTEEGMKLYKNVLALEIQSKVLIETTKKSQNREMIRFNCTTTIMQYIIPDLIKKWINTNPNADIYIKELSTEDCIKSINNGEVEFAIVEGFFDNSLYTNRIIKQTYMRIVVSKNHPLTKKDEVTLEDLFDYTLLLRKSELNYRANIPNVILKNKYTYKNFKKVVICGNFEVIKYLVKDNCGIALLHEDIYQKEVSEGLLVELPVKDFEIRRDLNMVYLPNSVDVTYINKMYEEITSYVHSQTKTND